MSNLTWVGGSTVSFATATSIAANIPSSLQDNDGVFAFVFARDTLTAPSGWSLVTSIAFTASGVTQTIYLYQKDSVASGDGGTSATWTQGSSGRMGVTYAAVRGSGRKPVVQESSATKLESTAYTITPTALTAERSNEIFLFGVSSVNATTGTLTPTPPTGATLFSGSSIGNYRLAGAYLSRSGTQSSSGSFNIQPGQTGSTNALGSIVARIVDNDFNPGTAAIDLTGYAPTIPGGGGSNVTVFQY